MLDVGAPKGHSAVTIIDPSNIRSYGEAIFPLSLLPHLPGKLSDNGQVPEPNEAGSQRQHIMGIRSLYRSISGGMLIRSSGDTSLSLDGGQNEPVRALLPVDEFYSSQNASAKAQKLPELDLEIGDATNQPADISKQNNVPAELHAETPLRVHKRTSVGFAPESHALEIRPNFPGRRSESPEERATQLGNKPRSPSRVSGSAEQQSLSPKERCLTPESRPLTPALQQQNGNRQPNLRLSISRVSGDGLELGRQSESPTSNIKTYAFSLALLGLLLVVLAFLSTSFVSALLQSTQTWH